jgi:hypothetical protein
MKGSFYGDRLRIFYRDNHEAGDKDELEGLTPDTAPDETEDMVGEANL